ncbi:radical SAM protein [uncultured Subdoligranulum sp.]|uniref:radical SAM protein n=1 Tax=uncultured Subdoligranulum sp. TaxID=512298 RepID=UPI0025EBE088|nr:radical SAM protein [uncultured Subdoligranulum sp.]
MAMKKHIFLSVTERCNLNCIYCFEKSKRPDVMSLEKAMEIIEAEMQAPDSAQLSIDFMGGEPFLEFERIRQICEVMWARDWPKPYKFVTTTNGTLVHGEIARWLESHRDSFLCFLSIDGPREVHNLNRTNSFDQIDVAYFRRNWPQAKAKTICSKKSLKYLAETVEYISELGFPEIDLKLAYAFDWTSAEEMAELERQFARLVDFYLEHPEYHPASLLDVDMTRLNFAGKPPVKWCTCGVETVSYDMQGNRFPCRYYQDLIRYGKVTPEQMWQEDYTHIQNTIKGRCRNCLLRDVCRTCYAYNMDTCGDYGLKNYDACQLSRVSAYYSAQLLLKKAEKGLAEGSPAALEGARQVVQAWQDGRWMI